MKSKKISKPTKKDKEWEKKVEERLKGEKIDLDHPRGKERFEKVVKRTTKKSDLRFDKI